jgi:small subunit ribosomal protein S16
MLSIRMQRTGRKGHAMFRVVVQESRLTPTSGKVVALLGSYDPHAKTVTLDKEKASLFLQNGAQPSDRAASLLQKEGVALPKWVKLSGKKTGKIRNAEKLRRNLPKETPKEASVETPEATTADEATEAVSEEVPGDDSTPATEEKAAEA